MFLGGESESFTSICTHDGKRRIPPHQGHQEPFRISAAPLLIAPHALERIKSFERNISHRRTRKIRRVFEHWQWRSHNVFFFHPKFISALLPPLNHDQSINISIKLFPQSTKPIPPKKTAFHPEASFENTGYTEFGVQPTLGLSSGAHQFKGQVKL